MKSLTTIAVTVVVVGGFKMKIYMKIICLDGRIGWRWLIGTGKWLERLAMAVETEFKNVFAGSDCSGTGGREWYR